VEYDGLQWIGKGREAVGRKLQLARLLQTIFRHCSDGSVEEELRYLLMKDSGALLESLASDRTPLSLSFSHTHILCVYICGLIVMRMRNSVVAWQVAGGWIVDDGHGIERERRDRSARSRCHAAAPLGGESYDSRRQSLLILPIRDDFKQHSVTDVGFEKW
jgi:hypothetical protein